MVYKVNCYKECNLGQTSLFISMNCDEDSKEKILSMFGRKNILSIQSVSDPKKVISRFNSVFA